MKSIYKEDLRVIRTKKLLREALISLLQQKSIEKINVIEICDKAMVHRATFYKYFEDKYHLLSCAIEDIKEDVLIASTDKIEFDSTEDMYLYLVNRILDYVETNKGMLFNIMEKNKSDTLIQIIYDVMEKCIEYYLQKNSNLENGRVPIAIASRFYAGGVTAVVLWWVQGNKSASKEQLLEYSKLIISEGITVAHRK